MHANVGSVISIVSCVGRRLLLHLDLILPIVDAIFPAPKLPEGVQRATEASLYLASGSSSPLSSVLEMNAQTLRALRLGRRILIRYRGKTTRHERTLLAIVSDQEWFVVERGGRIWSEHMDAADEVRLIPVSGERPTGVIGPIEIFDPAPTREQRQAWTEEGTLSAVIELERQANVSLLVRFFVLRLRCM